MQWFRCFQPFHLLLQAVNKTSNRGQGLRAVWPAEETAEGIHPGAEILVKAV
jgi:hypothetical protein